MPRSIATALTLVLLLGMLPAASAAAAEDGPPSRTPADAIGTSLDLDVLMSASHELALDTALKVQVASLKLDVAKAAQRERARQYRRDKRAVKKALSGKERDCRLAALERTYLAERDRFEAEATEYRAELGYYNKQKALTKVGKRFGRAARFVGGVLMETIKEVGPVVLEAQLTGGLGPGGWKALARRHGVRTLKRKGKDALFGALVRRATGPADAALAAATKECEPEPGVAAKLSPMPAQAIKTGLGSGTGGVAYEGVLEYPNVHVGLVWESFMPSCAYYQSHTLKDDKKKHRLALAFDLDRGTFIGSASGEVQNGDERGAFTRGSYTLWIPSGKISRVGDRTEWKLSGTAAVSEGLKQVSPCVIKEWPGTETRAKKGKDGGQVTITGSIELIGDTWLLGMLAERGDSKRGFRLSVTDVTVATWDSPAGIAGVTTSSVVDEVARAKRSMTQAEARSISGCAIAYLKETARAFGAWVSRSKRRMTIKAEHGICGIRG